MGTTVRVTGVRGPVDGEHRLTAFSLCRQFFDPKVLAAQWPRCRMNLQDGCDCDIVLLNY